MKKSKLQRIKSELKAAGVTSYGMSKLSIKEIPNILHDNETIGGVVYGQVGGGNTAVLLATNKRVLYIDRRMMFMTTDELTYDVVSGIKVTSAAPFTSVSLHTRIRDYTIRFANAKCARIFTEYIEKRRIEAQSPDDAPHRTSAVPQPAFKEQGNEAVQFLRNNEIAVLSTVDQTGNVHGSVVYYFPDAKNDIYFMTKTGTNKSTDVIVHGQTALTIHEPGTLKTLQIQGIAEMETDPQIKSWVFDQAVKPRSYKEGTHLPPVTKLKKGSFVIIRIHPTHIKYSDYTK